MILCYSVVACLLTAFLLIAVAMIFSGPDPLREAELRGTAERFVNEWHAHYKTKQKLTAVEKEVARLTWVVKEQGKMIDLKNDQIETLSNVINDRHGKGKGFKGLGGH